jgi:hypothetical protein
MQATVDGFMRRFGRGETVDDREAAQYHDRFVSTHDDDRDFDNKTYHDGATGYLGKLPDDQFHEAAKNAVAQAADKNEVPLSFWDFFQFRGTGKFYPKPNRVWPILDVAHTEVKYDSSPALPTRRAGIRGPNRCTSKPEKAIE